MNKNEKWKQNKTKHCLKDFHFRHADKRLSISLLCQKFPKISKNLPNFQNFLPVALRATDLLHPSGQSTARIGSLCSGIGPEPALNKKTTTSLFYPSLIFEDQGPMLLNIWRLTSVKHSNLLGQFLSSEENEVL
jgi:hypothetical protein